MLSNIVQNKKFKQIAILYTSSIIGVLLGILNSVINTRNLVPELYGDYRYVQNIITFVSSLLLVGFFVSGSRLLALSKDEDNSRRIRGAMCVILGITYIILMFVMSILSIIAYYKGQLNLISIYLVSIPLCGNVLLLNYINTTAQGDNHINRIAIARLLPSLLYCIVAYLVYRYFGATPELMLALFNGTAIIVLSAIIISTKPSFKNIKKSLFVLNEENKKYGFNVYIGSMMGVSTQYLAGIALGAYCETNADVGFYTLALSMAHPLATLPATIGTTFFKKFAVQNRIEKKVIKGSVIITALSFLVFSLLIKYIVGVLYDESYSPVGIYAIYLATAACLNGMGDLFNRYLGAHGQGKQLRNGAFACGIVVLLGCFILIRFWGINGAILTRVLSSLTYLGFMLLYYFAYVNKTNQITMTTDE